MAETSYPFDNVNTTEAQYSQLFRRLQWTGVSGDATTTDLKVSADSSGLNVKVAPGFAIVRGHAYVLDADLTLNVSAGATNARRDLVVLRLDPSANSVSAVVKAGTAASSPVDPTLTQTEEGVYELALARVEVPANAVTVSASNVTDRRTYIGSQVGMWTSALRPATPEIGMFGYNTSIGRFEGYTPSGWKVITLESDPVLASQISSSEQLKLNAGTINGAPIFVQATAPTNPVLNTLHFWGE